MPSYQDSRSIRVCHVAMGDLWAGAEVHLATLLRELVTKPRIEVSAVLLNEGNLARVLRLLGVPVIVFPEGQWSAFRILKELTAYCRCRRFDLLHTHKYKDNILGTLAAMRVGTPFVVRTMHGLPEPFRGMQACRIGAYQFLDHIALKRGASRIIAVSSDIERTLRKTYGVEKVVQIHNGISLQEHEGIRAQDVTRKNLGIDAGCYVIGTVGRLMPVKGHEHFLACAQQLLQTRQDLHFLIVGDGPLYGQLSEMADRLGISKKVAFLGHREDTDELLRAMDIFVLPSLHEGIPMVILEAMALARPIVASRVGGIPEVVKDGVQGLLVSPAAPDELANACLKLLNESDLAERYGAAARLRVHQEFSAESMAAKTYMLYRELLEGNSQMAATEVHLAPTGFRR